MSIQLIKAFTKNEKPPTDQINRGLNVSEFFTDTIQGEGINTGCPATFLRLQGCTLSCTWCDTAEVWRHGSFWSTEQLFQLMEDTETIDKLRKQHLVITGGSPLKQQFSLIDFLKDFRKKYNFLPYIEIENECTLTPHPILADMVSCWNNSPKLENSGNSIHSRYKPTIISKLSSYKNSWFKFVINRMEDWYEIEESYLLPGYIKKEQVILMPEGSSIQELEKTRKWVVQIAIHKSVRYCTREHIMLWDQKTGV